MNATENKKIVAKEYSLNPTSTLSLFSAFFMVVFGRQNPQIGLFSMAGEWFCDNND